MTDATNKKLTAKQLKELRQLNPRCNTTLECEQRADLPTDVCLTCPWYDYDVDWDAYNLTGENTHE